MKTTNYYAVDAVFLFVAPLIETSLSFVEKSRLARMNAFDTEMGSELLFDHNRAAWTAGELASLRSEI